MKMVNLLFLLIMVMLSIAFFTLLERKIIGYSQSRKGPNKVLILGIIQPIADAIKLLTKEVNLNFNSNFTIYMVAPLMNIVCSLLMWIVFPFLLNFSFMKMSILFMLSCMAFNTTAIMMMSWSSNSNYAFIGMIRSISQLISYEINLMMILIALIVISEQLNFLLMDQLQKYMPTVIITFPMIMLWLITVLAETNRTPFDFSEGESELISGFNIEYSSINFMMLFLSEYSSILLMSYISVHVFVSGATSTLVFYGTYSMFCLMFIWIRTTLPRFRYDKLMKLNWTQILPLTTILVFLAFPLKL
uniref:NADH-ubiquinone oxidoreductase chain 1 n=1 Tax=Bemisia afer TaxID=166114 RepID=A0A023IZQ6_BEMAF|nr:NADH dehydrogenase subunit 1 [Bemisia afer]AHC02247.1 NADH dehydrogenase subunit 1 [Bemisia afer]